MKRISEDGKCLRQSILSTAVSAIVLFLAIACHGGGYLHWESSAFLLNYTAERPFLQIIFDPLRNDWGLYQCRELSYFFDYIDANIIYFLLKHGIVWFISPISVMLILFCIWLQQYAGRRLFPRIPERFFIFYALALALYPAFTQMIFFRSSKLLAAAGLGILIFGSALRRLKDSGFWGRKAVICSGAVLAVLADRQGVFFVTAFTGIFAVMQFMKFSYTQKDIVRTGAGVVFAGIAANTLLVPLMIRIINGYFPDFSYQADFEITCSALFQAVEFVFANIGNAFCGIESKSAAVCGGVILCGVMLLPLRNFRRIPLYVVCGMFAVLTVCAWMMVSRHALIMDEGVIFSGYFTPSMMIFSFFLFAAVERLPEKLRKLSILLPLAVVVLRLMPYFTPEKLFHEDKYQVIYQNAAPKFEHAVKNPGCEYRKFLMPYRMERLLEKLNSK
jgi:hypothetical protein